MVDKALVFRPRVKRLISGWHPSVAVGFFRGTKSLKHSKPICIRTLTEAVTMTGLLFLVSIPSKLKSIQCKLAFDTESSFRFCVSLALHLNPKHEHQQQFLERLTHAPSFLSSLYSLGTLQSPLNQKHECQQLIRNPQNHCGARGGWTYCTSLYSLRH